LIDTPAVRRDTRLIVMLTALLLGAGLRAAPAAAAPRDLGARVLWVRGERVVLAAADSGVFEPGMRLTFLDRRKPAAAGEVTRVLEGELALARLVSGSLARIRHLERLRVLGEPPRRDALPRLVLGVPGRGRTCLLFTCAGLMLDPASPPHGYRTDAVTDHLVRLVRGPEFATAAPWPDTLVLRLFDEAADQEIALERGEIDAGVFWPGELSARMREAPRWSRPLLGLRSRGVLAAFDVATGMASDSGAAVRDSLAFAALNRDLFRGDLVPWPHGEALAGGGRPAATRYVVEPACPGRRAIERFLERAAGPTPAPIAAAVSRLAYLDVAIDDPGALAAAGRGVAPGTPDARVRPLFLAGCPLVCPATLRPRLEALGADALVNLLACPPAERAP